MSKSEYNRTYYLNRQAELKQKAKERERQKRTKEPSKLLPSYYFLLGLVLASSLLLLTEMAAFYESWIRAGVLEGLVMTFSILTHTSVMKRLLYKAVAFGICALSVYGMSAKHLEEGLKSYRTDQITQKRIEELEQTIQEKRSQRDRLASKEWITAANKSEKLIDELRIELDSLRSSFTNMKPMVLHTTIIQILCRVFLMVGNVLLIQRWVERFEISTFSLKVQSESLKEPNVVSIRKAGSK